MKKLALIALAAPVFAGTPEPVVTMPAPAPAAPCCAVELGVSGNMAAKDLFKQFPNKEVDTVGIDLTAVHSFTPKHAITFRIGAAQGDETEHADEARLKTYLRTVSIMPGYRFTQPVSEKTSLFCGVNAGLVNQHVHLKMLDTNADDSAWGWGATAEVGVRYQLCPCSEIFAAYQLSGNTVNNDFGHGLETHRQIHNGVRAGVSIKF
ncbi:MAG: porin family protein [Akkermansia sp.]|nr:porin family protein [Akkermansia sp.]